MSTRNVFRASLLVVLAACASDEMTQTPAPADFGGGTDAFGTCLLYTSPSPRD